MDQLSRGSGKKSYQRSSSGYHSSGPSVPTEQATNAANNSSSCSSHSQQEMLLSLNSSLQQVHNSLIDLANSMTATSPAQPQRQAPPPPPVMPHPPPAQNIQLSTVTHGGTRQGHGNQQSFTECSSANSTVQQPPPPRRSQISSSCDPGFSKERSMRSASGSMHSKREPTFTDFDSMSASGRTRGSSSHAGSAQRSRWREKSHPSNRSNLVTQTGDLAWHEELSPVSPPSSADLVAALAAANQNTVSERSSLPSSGSYSSSNAYKLSQMLQRASLGDRRQMFAINIANPNSATDDGMRSRYDVSPNSGQTHRGPSGSDDDDAEEYSGSGDDDNNDNINNEDESVSSMSDNETSAAAAVAQGVNQLNSDPMMRPRRVTNDIVAASNSSGPVRNSRAAKTSAPRETRLCGIRDLMSSNSSAEFGVGVSCSLGTSRTTSSLDHETMILSDEDDDEHDQPSASTVSERLIQSNGGGATNSTAYRDGYDHEISGIHEVECEEEDDDDDESSTEDEEVVLQQHHRPQVQKISSDASRRFLQSSSTHKINQPHSSAASSRQQRHEDQNAMNRLSGGSGSEIRTSANLSPHSSIEQIEMDQGNDASNGV